MHVIATVTVPPDPPRLSSPFLAKAVKPQIRFINGNPLHNFSKSTVKPDAARFSCDTPLAHFWLNSIEPKWRTTLGLHRLR